MSQLSAREVAILASFTVTLPWMGGEWLRYNECRDAPCGPGQTCADFDMRMKSLGDFVCKCDDNGVEAIGTAATCEIDECDDPRNGNVNPCGDGQKCEDPDKSENKQHDFVCTCENDDTVSRIDGPATCERDECDSNPCGDDQTCNDPDMKVKSLGDFVCKCDNGVEAIGTSATCEIDECNDPNNGNVNPCGDGQKCEDPDKSKNKQHDFVCTCEDDTSVTRVAGPATCERDECDPNPCGDDQTCTDPDQKVKSLGDFVCKCDNGVEAIGTAATCEIDECDDPRNGNVNPCGDGQKCEDPDKSKNKQHDFVCTCENDDAVTRVDGPASCERDHNSCGAGQLRKVLLLPLLLLLLGGAAASFARSAASRRAAAAEASRRAAEAASRRAAAAAKARAAVVRQVHAWIFISRVQCLVRQRREEEVTRTCHVQYMSVGLALVFLVPLLGTLVLWFFPAPPSFLVLGSEVATTWIVWRVTLGGAWHLREQSRLLFGANLLLLLLGAAYAWRGFLLWDTYWFATIKEFIVVVAFLLVTCAGYQWWRVGDEAFGITLLTQLFCVSWWVLSGSLRNLVTQWFLELQYYYLMVVWCIVFPFLFFYWFRAEAHLYECVSSPCLWEDRMWGLLEIDTTGYNLLLKNVSPPLRRVLISWCGEMGRDGGREVGRKP